MTGTSPYAPPAAALQEHDPAADSQAESIRSSRVRHEVQLKAVGSLYLFFGAMLLVAAIGTAIVMFDESTRSGAAESLGMMTAVTAVYLVLAALQLTVGYGFRRLRSWVRIPGGIIAGIGLLAIPVGTLINGYILYLMFGERGRVVLAPNYRAIIDATPHIRYRRTVGDWIALGILVLMVLGVVGLVVFGLR